MYLVKEVFLTLQGEGYWSGRPAVFCRFSNCNLWNGKEEDRSKSICSFCDTDFVGGTEYTTDELATAIRSLWPGYQRRGFRTGPMVVFTGGEPALQLDQDLVDWIGPNWYVAVETNGTVPLKAEVDWVCVSPKTPKLRVDHGDELKLVYPQTGKMQPEQYQDLQFSNFWVSPMDGPNIEENTALAVDYVLQHPQWRLNTQTHKTLGIR